MTNVDKISIVSNYLLIIYQYGMRIIDRLDVFMAEKGLNDNQVTVSAGLSVGLLGKARSGKSDVGKKAIEKILTFYQDLNRVWLLTGEGNMIKDNNPLNITKSSDNIVDDEKRMLIESINKMTEAADRNSRTLEKIVDYLVSGGVSSEELKKMHTKDSEHTNDQTNGRSAAG